MKKIFLLLSMCFCTLSSVAQSDQAHLITQKGAGKVKFGMNLQEARRAVRPLKTKRGSDAHSGPWLYVLDGKNIVMSVGSACRDEEFFTDPSVKLDVIEVWSKDYSTKQGVRPGMLLSEVEKKLGKVKEIGISESDSRDYAQFERMPDGLWYQLGVGGGIYENDSRTTKKYTPDTIIRAIGWRSPAHRCHSAYDTR
jgi:hypothetical protein